VKARTNVWPGEHLGSEVNELSTLVILALFFTMIHFCSVVLLMVEFLMLFSLLFV